MSPILVRPVREQLEHDRVIRQLQKDLTRRKVEVAINPGNEQNVGLGSGARKEFPDVVLFAADKGRRVLGVVEVETGESINHLEAMAEWGHYARLRAPFHLYVPMGSVDLARRLAADNNVQVAEFHSYHQIGDLIRFASVHRATGSAALVPDEEPETGPAAKSPARKATPPKTAAKAGPVARPARPATVTRGRAPVARAARPAPRKKSVPKPAAHARASSAKAGPKKAAAPAARRSAAKTAARRK